MLRLFGTVDLALLLLKVQTQPTVSFSDCATWIAECETKGS